MHKEEFTQKLHTLEIKKLSLQSKFLLDVKGGNLQDLKKKLKEELYILHVEMQALRTQFTVNKLQNNLRRKLSSNTTIENFINACIILEKNSRTTKKDIFEAYILYCARTNVPTKIKYQSFCSNFPNYFPVGKVSALRAGKNPQGEEKRTQMFSGIALRMTN